MKQFFKKYQEVLQDERLTRTQGDIISVLINRAEYHNKPFYCYESWIASEVRCSRRTVIRAIKYFEEIGLVSISKVYNKVTKKTTNYYTVNIDTFNNKVVEETKEVVSGVDAPTVKEEVIEVVNTVKEENIMNNTNDEIPYDLLYPYEAEMIEAMSIPINDFSTPKTEEKVNNEEMINNVKECLKKAANKDNKGVVYCPELMKEYGYKYRDIVECVKELEKRGELTYTPTEKNSKLYHNYTLSIKGTIKEWEQICIAAYGQSKGNMDYLNKVSMYDKQFSENGIANEELVKVMMNVLNKYGNKKIA